MTRPRGLSGRVRKISHPPGFEIQPFISSKCKSMAHISALNLKLSNSIFQAAVHIHHVSDTTGSSFLHTQSFSRCSCVIQSEFSLLIFSYVLRQDNAKCWCAVRNRFCTSARREVKCGKTGLCNATQTHMVFQGAICILRNTIMKPARVS